MEINIHHFVHFPSDPEEIVRLKRIESKVDLILSTVTGISKFQTEESKKMDADVQAIIAQAKANENVEQSAVTAINDLGTKLLAAINAAPSLSAEDRAALQAQVTEMQTNAAALGTAIATGDPATVTSPPAGDGTGTSSAPTAS